MVATKKEWLASLREEPAKHDRWIIVPRVLAALLLIFLTFVAVKAHAQPLYQAISNDGKIVITLYSESCPIPDVKNLPKKVVWQQDGKTYVGCAGLFDNEGIIAIWLDDHTVQVVPASIFAKVTSA